MTIAIIGAGITGLYLAFKLAERGEDVTVFEKKKRIGKQACSGLFSERILEFIPQSQSLIQNQINSVLINFPGRTVKVEFSKKFFVMNRFELDNLVARLAENSGAKITLNHNVSISNINILLRGRRRGLCPRLDLRPALRDLVFDRIIGCDGPNSIVRETLGLPDPDYRLAIQGFIQPRSRINSLRGGKEDYSNFVETWPTEQGFVWKIPRGKELMKFPSSTKSRETGRRLKKGTQFSLTPSSTTEALAEVKKKESSLTSLRESSIIEYGIIGNPKKVKEIFDEFLKKNNLQLERLESALVPQAPTPKFWWWGQGFLIPSNPKITLCGDASGLTKPWSGGGVIWGLTAADILLKNFPDFLRYKNETRNFFLPKIMLSKLATKVVYFLGFKMPWLLPKKIKIEGDFLF